MGGRSPGPSQAVIGCRNSQRIVGNIPPARFRRPLDAHEPPQTDCTCGIYAAKTLHHLRSAGFERYGICGEVFLWGKVVEHERGWRAQLAYPKNLFLSPDALPFTLAEIRSRLQALTLYGSDIFVLANGETISLWANDSGYSPAGLDYLIEMSKRYYDRRRLERTLKTGDRVAVLGLGIAVVEHVDGKEVHAVLWSKNVVRIGHKEIVWDEANMRWEANHSSVSQTKPKAMSLACTQVRQKG
jgi:hypothetical protein